MAELPQTPKRKRGLASNSSASHPDSSPSTHRDSPNLLSDSPSTAVTTKFDSLNILAGLGEPLSPTFHLVCPIHKKNWSAAAQQDSATQIKVQKDYKADHSTSPNSSDSTSTSCSVSASEYPAVVPSCEATDELGIQHSPPHPSSSAHHQFDHLRASPTPTKNKKRKKSPPPPSEPSDPLTWHESEITGHLMSSPDDDGEGINGIGFRPTPAMAYARAQKRRAQVEEWRAMVAKEERQKRSERRMRIPPTAMDETVGFPQSGARKMVRFV